MTPDRAAEIYRQEFADTRRERLFLSSVSFFTTFAATRAITHAIRAGVGPFHNLTVGGRHFHHLVLGIAGFGTGYLWLIEVDTRDGNGDRRRAGEIHVDPVRRLLRAQEGSTSSRCWLDLEDVYWTRQGRASVDAVVLFGGLLSIGLWEVRSFGEFHELSHI